MKREGVSETGPSHRRAEDERNRRPLMRRIDDPPNRASSPFRVRARGLPSSTVCIRLPALAGLIHLPFRKMRSWRPGIEPTAVAPPIAVDADWRRPELAGLCKLHSTADPTR